MCRRPLSPGPHRRRSLSPPPRRRRSLSPPPRRRRSLSRRSRRRRSLSRRSRHRRSLSPRSRDHASPILRSGPSINYRPNFRIFGHRFGPSPSQIREAIRELLYIFIDNEKQFAIHPENKEVGADTENKELFDRLFNMISYVSRIPVVCSEEIIAVSKMKDVLQYEGSVEVDFDGIGESHLKWVLKLKDWD